MRGRLARTPAGRARTLLATACVAALGAAGCDSSEQARPERTVRVDFGGPDPPRASMVGFLHSVTSVEPPDPLVAPLRPRLWRGTPQTVPYGRASRLGAAYELVVSDLWGYPPTWQGRGPPYADLGRWEDFVRRLARGNRGRNLRWDVWNEPDGKTFWKGSRAQLFETYAVAYRVLRDELGPEAVVGGPSISGYDHGYLRAFLDHCRRRGCEVNFLSWHENLGPDRDIASVDDHLRRARAELVENPAYARLRIGRVEVNESVDKVDQYRPGESVGYLSYLERGGADAAARACWDRPRGVRNCRRPTLDGLLVPGGLEPRAVWWVYRRYADGVDSRVASETSDPHVAALASSRSPGRKGAQIIIGHLRGAGHGDQPSVDVELELRGLSRLPFLARAEEVEARVTRVPDRALPPLVEPQPAGRSTVAISNGRARLLVENVRLHEAYFVDLSDPSG